MTLVDPEAFETDALTYSAPSWTADTNDLLGSPRSLSATTFTSTPMTTENNEDRPWCDSLTVVGFDTQPTIP